MKQTLDLDLEIVKETFQHTGELMQIGTLQVVIYTAVGGGILGRLYAEQPKHAYIDPRVGKRPYSRKDIERMRLTLVAMAEAKGLDPCNLPPLPDFHNCGVF